LGCCWNKLHEAFGVGRRHGARIEPAFDEDDGADQLFWDLVERGCLTNCSVETT